MRDNIADVNKELAESVQNALDFVDTLDQSLPSTRLLRLELEALQRTTEQSGNAFRISFEQFRDTLAGSIQTGLQTFVDRIVDGENAVKSLGEAFRQFAANFLRRIAEMIIEQLAFNAAQQIAQSLNFGGLFGGLLAFHQGGVVGQGGIPLGRNRLVGDEYLAVLQRGERVLTESDQRQLSRSGGQSSGGVTVINAVDATSFLEQALRQRDGQDVLLNAIQANQGQIRGVLGV